MIYRLTDLLGAIAAKVYLSVCEYAHAHQQNRIYRYFGRPRVLPRYMDDDPVAQMMTSQGFNRYGKTWDKAKTRHCSCSDRSESKGDHLCL
jgi:hypothetical protein